MPPLSKCTIKRSRARCSHCDGRGYTMRVAGPTLRAIRQRAQISIAELGRRVLMSRSYLSDVELEIRPPTPRVISIYNQLQRTKK